VTLASSYIRAARFPGSQYNLKYTGRIGSISSSSASSIAIEDAQPVRAVKLGSWEESKLAHTSGEELVHSPTAVVSAVSFQHVRSLFAISPAMASTPMDIDHSESVQGNGATLNLRRTLGPSPAATSQLSEVMANFRPAKVGVESDCSSARSKLTLRT